MEIQQILYQQYNSPMQQYNGLKKQVKYNNNEQKIKQQNENQNNDIFIKEKNAEDTNTETDMLSLYSAGGGTN